MLAGHGIAAQLFAYYAAKQDEYVEFMIRVHDVILHNLAALKRKKDEIKSAANESENVTLPQLHRTINLP